MIGEKCKIEVADNVYEFEVSAGLKQLDLTIDSGTTSVATICFEGGRYTDYSESSQFPDPGELSDYIKNNSGDDLAITFYAAFDDEVEKVELLQKEIELLVWDEREDKSSAVSTIVEIETDGELARYEISDEDDANPNSYIKSLKVYGGKISRNGLFALQETIMPQDPGKIQVEVQPMKFRVDGKSAIETKVARRVYMDIKRYGIALGIAE
jgi:hypothetical protein